jgi:hypothetical protein
MRSAGLAPDEADFYTAQSSFSTPGALASRYAELPADPAELSRVARDLMIHRLEGELFGYEIPRDRLHDDAETRYLDDILAIVVERDDAPLTRRRVLGDRFVGVCRDFALLHCSFLRHAGVPARVRSGFADYFGAEGFHFDHMITEYWGDGRGWVLADPQLADPLVTDAFKMSFDPMDVPRDRFLVAGEAWRRIRAGAADPKTFGIPLPDRLLAGEAFVAGNIRLDLAALNKVETLLWDVWGAGADEEEELADDAVRRLYDEVAEVTCGDVTLDAVRRMFTGNEDLRTPSTVLSLAPFNGPRQVTLRR